MIKPIFIRENTSLREEFKSRVAVLFTQINNLDEHYKMWEFGIWFVDAWGKLKEDLVIEDLLIPSEEDNYKGLTAIWLIARAATYSRSAAFLAVWDKFHESIKLEFFLNKAQGGKDKGKSALWYLATAAQSHPELFLKVWKKFKNHLKLTDFLDEALEDKEKGQSVLWNLACAEFGHTRGSEVFSTVWEKYNDEIKLSHLLNQALSGGWNGVNILCFLAMGAANNRVQPFQKVWHRFKSQMTLAHLLDNVIGVNCRNICALLNLEKAPIPHLMQDIFSQVPGVMPRVYFERYRNFSSLLEARNLFFITLELINSHGISENSLALVFEKAEAAQKAGYVNAFYDLGKFLASQNLFKEMARAYKKIPSASYHYADVSAELSEYFFGKVLNINFSQDSWEIAWRHYLNRTLAWALKSGLAKNELIQKIAYMYIYQEKAISTETAMIIPQALLESIPDKNSVYSYFKIFDQVKATLPQQPIPPLIFTASHHNEDKKKRTLLTPAEAELQSPPVKRLGLGE